ncbi:MAG: hypothetical protein Q4C75_00605 [Bergeyella zoohelcum]|nr:hypothetical protein [Bergeyella zoohelcum]
MIAIKKTAIGLGIMALGLANAQSHNMRDVIKLGVNGGIAVPTENASASLGLNIAYQHLVTPNFGLGIASGYSHYFGRDNNGIKNNDFGVVPVAALLKFYPNRTGFYLGTDLGYGFIVGKDDVASNYTTDRPNGGFYIKPEIGYHNKNWNFFIQYQKTFTGDNGKIGSQEYNAGILGAGVAYNISLSRLKK